MRRLTVLLGVCALLGGCGGTDEPDAETSAGTAFDSAAASVTPVGDSVRDSTNAGAGNDTTPKIP